MNWKTYHYLKSGSPTQLRAYRTLRNIDIFDKLQPFDPALVSTVCVELHTKSSDLDIICEVKNKKRFISAVSSYYSKHKNFEVHERTDGAVVAEFDTRHFPVEVFGKNLPVEQQNGWRHLTVMKRVLSIEPRVRTHVKRMKRNELATEEAFARLLSLKGDPYEAFLSIEDKTDQELQKICRRALN